MTAMIMVTRHSSTSPMVWIIKHGIKASGMPGLGRPMRMIAHLAMVHFAETS